LHTYYRQHVPNFYLPDTEWNSTRRCSIPLFPDMTTDDANPVVDAIEKRYGQSSVKPYPIRCVSIVIPVYNEQDSLPELLRRTEAACQQLHHEYEIVLVDDGSRDNSAQILEDAANREGSPVVAVILNRNYGQHAAIMAGFEHCKGDVVITLDADLQNPPEEIPRLVAQAELGYDVVATVRNNRKDSALRRWPSKLINLAVQRSTGVAMSDYGCMLRAYRRTIVDAMLACSERSTFIPILANSFARHTTEIPVLHAEREHGESKYSPMRLINLMFDLITCMTTTPLRLLSIVGFAMAALGVVFAITLIFLRLVFGAEWAGDGSFVLFAVLFVFTGGQFIGMGLLGEYLGRMYSDVRARPRFFVEKVLRSQPATPAPVVTVDGLTSTSSDQVLS
jgi:undecaprenyl-phosphate 4-deoxy-4-formamido-L-arabinose transferase